MEHHLTDLMTQNYFYSSTIVRMWSPELGLVLFLTTCVTLGKLINHSEPVSSSVK